MEYLIELANKPEIEYTLIDTLALTGILIIAIPIILGIVNTLIYAVAWCMTLYQNIVYGDDE